jgi:preprotein translocase subunit SecG
MSVLINIFTFILILISVFLVLVVLMQRAKSDGAVAAMGGGGMESTFGAETGNVLVSATKYATIAFFVLSFLLYLAHVRQANLAKSSPEASLPVVTAPATTQPATPPPGDAPKP